uniref:Thiamine biosynthesis protein n=1 Tax=Gracilariopsis longissima TaxID=172976 RepID=A0A345U9T1_9FLOR|nr:Thiamine biosynthesis protein [Gracilariopsis longissima]AXI97217.1 Thiamine biosynthesis protein [Gracilariopsis longissima]UAD89133.1 Thiamine biosynthesis protein [Gracilariopsis longissima]
MNKVYNTIFINGQAFNCAKSMSLKELLVYLEFDLSLIVIEYNNNIVNSYEFKNIFLKPQDKIEIITIVGGG